MEDTFATGITNIEFHEDDALDYLDDKLGTVKRNYCTAKINPRLCKEYNIDIEIEQRLSEDELADFPVSIPHLKICLDVSATPKQYAYLRLDKPEYLPKTKSADIGKKKAAIIDVLSSPWQHYLIRSQHTNRARAATGYDAAVEIWIDTYSDNNKFSKGVFRFDDDGVAVMPDYSLL